MGACLSTDEISKPTSSGTMTPVDETTVAASTDRRIARALRDDAASAKAAIKLLLLGAGECGKSTILKQFKILHKNGFSAQEKVEAVELIHANTLQSIQALCQACIDLSIPLDPEQTAAASALLEQSALFPAPETVALLHGLFTSVPLQSALARSNEFYLLDSAPYYLSLPVLQRTLSPGYVPTEADILRSRLATSGIIENDFVIDKLLFRIMDVGGQRGERKKWIHCFEDVAAILFISSLNEFDQCLAEDRSRNRLLESLSLFEGIISLPWFNSTHIILFLNKNDLFMEKVRRVDLSAYFPDFDGGVGDYEEALEFIKELFFSKNLNPSKTIYAHVTDATDTQSIAFVWGATKHIILQQNLTRAGLIMA